MSHDRSEETFLNSTAGRARVAPSIVAALVAAAVLAAGPWAEARAGVLLRITGADCHYLASHVAEPGVAYEPGVDVHGNAVVPADIDDGGGLELRQAFTIDIAVNVARRLGIPSDPARFRDRANIGVLEVRGRELYFNGQRLAPGAAGPVAAACSEQGKTEDR